MSSLIRVVNETVSITEEALIWFKRKLKTYSTITTPLKIISTIREHLGV